MANISPYNATNAARSKELPEHPEQQRRYGASKQTETPEICAAGERSELRKYFLESEKEVLKDRIDRTLKGNQPPANTHAVVYKRNGKLVVEYH